MDWIRANTPKESIAYNTHGGGAPGGRNSNEHARAAEDVFGMVDRGMYQLAISYIVIMDVYHKLTRPYEPPKNGEDTRPPEDELSRAVEESFSLIEDYLFSLGGNAYRFGSGPDGGGEYGMTELARRGMRHLPPQPRLDPVEGRSLNSLLPGTMDYLHLQIAAKESCGIFFTRDYKKLNQGRSFNHMRIEMV
ncbi:hypothetical protein CENSYa_1763 [Cenarchaeum symbiosum A]|uniref:Uncharacterized protein n=1 Tax=Cenarchaeum symbiosum (strain A) TaxID=414004 RepID=A0RYF7_CENSY|nr:hypothetical protein CENSYa_1763 [Cenarchaeum symbiosum A]